MQPLQLVVQWLGSAVALSGLLDHWKEFPQGVLGIEFSRPLFRTVSGFLLLGSRLLRAIEYLDGMVGQVMGDGLGCSQK